MGTNEENMQNRKIKRKNRFTKSKIIRKDQQIQPKLKRKQTGNNLKEKQIKKMNRRKKKQKRKHIKKFKGKNSNWSKRKISKTKRLPRNKNLVGDHCNWLDFGTARIRGSSCTHGTKMVIKNKKGVRKQFLLTNGKTIYGFAIQGEKFANCTDLAEITDSIACKAVEGLSGVSLSGSKRAVPTGSRQKFVGKSCEWIDISKVHAFGQKCVDGTKLV